MRLRGDRGQVGGIEVLPFGFFVFVALTLVVVNVWGVIDAKLAVTSAAREGARVFAEAPDAATADRMVHERVRATLAAYGRDGDRASVSISTLGAPFARCTRFQVTVRYTIPVLRVPFIGGFGQLAPVESTFTELVDPFRSGLEGAATC